MNWTEVVIAVIGFFGGLIVCVITERATNKRHDKEMTLAQEKRLDEIKTEYNSKFDEIQKRIAQFDNSLSNTVSLIDLRLQNLTSAVEKHNTVIERTYALERKMSVVEEQIKVANHRIQDCESKLEKP